jgi:hypothetical protein
MASFCRSKSQLPAELTEESCLLTRMTPHEGEEIKVMTGDCSTKVKRPSSYSV